MVADLVPGDADGQEVNRRRGRGSADVADRPSLPEGGAGASIVFQCGGELWTRHGSRNWPSRNYVPAIAIRSIPRTPRAGLGASRLTGSSSSTAGPSGAGPPWPNTPRPTPG